MAAPFVPRRQVQPRAQTGPHAEPVRRVLIASKNPVKLKAAQQALAQCFPTLQLEVIARDAPSGVPDQPFGDEETLLGARNRVAALGADASERGDLVLAIEGGVGPSAQGQAGPVECFAWVCVRCPVTGAESTSRSGSFALPPPLCALITGPAALELGAADDRLFGRQRSGQGSGTIGRLSNGVLDRTQYYVQACICALVPYMQPEYYGEPYGAFLGKKSALEES
ncbi:hypothetical protein HYH03_014617 [Edaphochlamys debaryana]|uniref:inosine/xanthosine triphosphatase n=1 Tax=Edaphochlamys debaryana TaxID=47281 RepID=A0A836BTB6_9CHLO|nr:hypothetical protein HYH03_014617 [Edaphochlamys debaryana]|eukprot:KAG2486688.1 hypothetical protein HYH03_014617 [Edaphochlamys debaryana]